MIEDETKIEYNWNYLDCEEKAEIIKRADGLGIPPNFVQEMYKSWQLTF